MWSRTSLRLLRASAPRPRPPRPAWAALSVLPLSALALAFALDARSTVDSFAPLPLLLPRPLHLENAPAPRAESDEEVHLDPTTQTPFPTTLVAPDGTRLRLVGTGVRTVSFLRVRVYAVAFYLDPTTATLPAPPPAALEHQVEALLERSAAAVVILPLRATSLAHLRDGFARALVARLRHPRIAALLDPNPGSGSALATTTTTTTPDLTSPDAALADFKTLLPAARSLPKGHPLELYYSPVSRAVTFQLRDPQTPHAPPQVLGQLRHPLLATQLFVSYFAEPAAPSPELVQSVARRLAPPHPAPESN